MATVTPPSTRRLEQDQQRIRHPLQRLRKYINTYVALEALALVALFVTLAFWYGLSQDYTAFKSAGLDWVQVLPWQARLVILLVAVAALLAFVVYVVLTRLFKEFSDAALALVLERRFPRQLGDRLITAVELANPKKAAKYGYSPDLLAETVHEAAERVEQVPVWEVFAWRRLKLYAVILVLLTGGAYLFSAGSFCGGRLLHREAPATAGFSDFHDIALIWAERNLLMRNVLWPRRAHLEVLPFYPEEPDREPRIARDSPSPTLRVRAWKYVLADRDPERAPEGWRLLRWQDLRDNESLAGDVTVPELPADWKPRDPAVGMTVDEVELRLDAFPIRTNPSGGPGPEYGIVAPDGEVRPLMWSDLSRDKLGGLDVPALPGEWDPKAKLVQAASVVGLSGIGAIPAASRRLVGPRLISLSVDQVKAAAARAGPEASKELLAAVHMVLARLDRLGELRGALDRVDERARDRAMRRTMRKLIIPEDVTLIYKGRRTTNTVPMTRVAGNEFTGNFGDLKETVTYVVRGEDYVTAPRRLVVVELPRLEKLESEEERPAYLYYRPSRDGTLGEWRGRRQRFQPISVSLSGEITTLEVPAGTHVSLTGTCSKPLESVKLTAGAKDQKTLRVEPATLDEQDDRLFHVRIPDVRREQRFAFEFRDTDGVMGRRSVVITPREDVAPRIREFKPDEVIREFKKEYLVAVGCRIPFKARIRDDHGLARVRYGCRVIPADFLSDQKLVSLFGVGAVPLIGGADSRLMGAAYMVGLHKQMAATAGDDASEEQYIDLPAFGQALATRQIEGRPEVLERGTVEHLLSGVQKDPFRKLLSDFSVTPDPWMANDEDPQVPSRWVKAQDQRAPLACDLPLWRLRYKNNPLKDPDETKAQRRFIIEVRLLVDDTFVEGEIDRETRLPVPHTSPSSETFTIVVVPENELLARIASEEEEKYRDLLKLIKPLADNRDRLRDIAFELSAGGTQQGILNSMIARCDTLDDLLKSSHQDAKAVFQAYERIVREMRVNQVRGDVLHKVHRDIYRPLETVTSVQFDRTINAERALRGALADQGIPLAKRGDAARPKAQAARAELNVLVQQINDILTKMQGLAEINALIKELHEIEKQEGVLLERTAEVRRIRLRQLLEEKK